MRILILNDEPWDSGITAYANQIAEILQKNGEDVVLGVRPGRKPELLARHKGLATIPVSGMWDVRKVLRSEEWDVINVHTGRSHTWSLMAMQTRRSKRLVPLIRTRGDARELRVNPLSRWVYRKTQGVIASSELIRKQYEEGMGLNEEKARTIYPSIVADSEQAPFPKKKIGILGRLDPVKGHPAFLEAASRVLKVHPDAEFYIAGKEAGVTIQLLKNQAKELGIEKSLFFLGFQTSSFDFMRSCSMGVVASLGSEALSRACLEWMSVGRPIIGTVVGSIPELIEPQETGMLVPPGDSEAMAKAMIYYLDDPKKTEKVGKAGIELVKRRFSPKMQLEKTLRLFEWAKQNFRSA